MKLGIVCEGPVRVVLNQDGSDIDETEILQHFTGEVFLLLQADEVWMPPETSDVVRAVAQNQSADAPTTPVNSHTDNTSADPPPPGPAPSTPPTSRPTTPVTCETPTTSRGRAIT